jgi:ribosomal protein S18 acetylase RimI-like enzyme
MTAPTDPGAMFAAEVTRSCAASVRPEQEHDRAFLDRLFITCSPLAGLLPPALLEQQAQIRYESYAANFPAASRWIVMLAGDPIGRIALVWDHEDGSYGLDIALLPGSRISGIGVGLLRAWLATSDRLGRPACLHVDHDNRAMKLYRRLGFEAASDPQQPSIAMIRPVGGRATPA